MPQVPPGQSLLDKGCGMAQWGHQRLSSRYILASTSSIHPCHIPPSSFCGPAPCLKLQSHGSLGYPGCYSRAPALPTASLWCFAVSSPLPSLLQMIFCGRGLFLVRAGAHRVHSTRLLRPSVAQHPLPQTDVRFARVCEACPPRGAPPSTRPKARLKARQAIKIIHNTAEGQAEKCGKVLEPRLQTM